MGREKTTAIGHGEKKRRDHGRGTQHISQEPPTGNGMDREADCNKTLGGGKDKTGARRRDKDKGEGKRQRGVQVGGMSTNLPLKLNRLHHEPPLGRYYTFSFLKQMVSADAPS